MNFKFETIVQIFRKIMQLNAVIIWKSTDEYYRKIISKSGPKMDLYPAMNLLNNKVKYTFYPVLCFYIYHFYSIISEDIPIRRFYGTLQFFCKSNKLVECVTILSMDSDPIADPGTLERGGARNIKYMLSHAADIFL